METVLWILQSVLAAAMLGAGAMKLSQPRPALQAKGMEYVEDLTDQQVKGIGAIEVVAAIGLVLPAALDVAPVLTALAAAGVVAIMIGAGLVHLRRGEHKALPVNVVIGAIALFVAIERFGPNSL